MHGHLVLAACATLSACQSEAAYWPVYLPPAYSGLPAQPAAPIESGTSVQLDVRQQEAVIAGVGRWIKDSSSAQFGRMVAAKNRRGWITVCGYVNGRAPSGTYVGPSPYIGVLVGQTARPDFVVVEIAASSQKRATIGSLCLESGIPDID